MDSLHEGAIPDQERLERSDAKLAASYLERNIKETQSSLQSSRYALNSIERSRQSGWHPTHPGPAPHPEDGGMDHEDWNVANYEYRNYDPEGEKDEELDWQESLALKLDDLLSLDERVRAGDETAISQAADRERAYLAETEEAKALAEVEKGKELPGTKELHDQLLATIEQHSLEGVIPGGGTGPNGWQYEGMRTQNDYYYKNSPYNHTFVRESPDGSSYTEKVTISANPEHYRGATVDYLVLPTPTEESQPSTQSPVEREVQVSEDGIARQKKYVTGNAFMHDSSKNGFGADGLELQGFDKRNATLRITETDIELLRAKVTEIKTDIEALKTASQS